MASLRSPSGAVLILLTCLIVILGGAAADTTLPPVKSLNLRAFQGRWYEIASSARLKFATQIGTKCNFVTYTQEKRNPAVLDVAISANASLQMSPWAYEGLDVFTATWEIAYTACQFLAVLGPPFDGGRKMQAAVATMRQQISAIVLASGSLAQGSTKGSSTAKLAKAIKTNAANIQGLVKKVMKGLGKGSGNTTAELSAVPAAASLSDSIKADVANIKSLVKQRKKALASDSHGADAYALGIVSLAARTISTIADVMKSVETITPDSRGGIDWYGTATQDKKAPGIFIVNVTDLQYFSRYNVLALEGDASKQYTAALIYDYNNDLDWIGNNALSYDVVILSRSKTLKAATYNKFLAALSKIDLSCDNPLIPTFQDTGADCALSQ